MTGTFLGYMLRIPTKDAFSTVEDAARDRALARQIFGLTAEQSEHPTLCFAEPHGFAGLFFDIIIMNGMLEVWLYDKTPSSAATAQT